MYCAALCDRLEGVASIVSQPFHWQLLIAGIFLQFFLSKFTCLHTVRLFTIFTWWVMKSRSKSDVSLCYFAHLVSTYSNNLRKNKQKLHYFYLCRFCYRSIRFENKKHCVWVLYMYFIECWLLQSTAKNRFHRWHHCSKPIISLHMRWCRLASAHNIFKNNTYNI